MECPLSPTFQKLVIISWCWATMKINPCSKVIFGGVWYQNSSLKELEMDWAFLEQNLVWELEGNLTLLQKKELDCNEAASIFMVLATGRTKIAIFKQL